MSDLLSDADEVSDELYLAALDFAVTPAEIAFRDVLTFHRDVLNGGLDQALDNEGKELDRYLKAYREVGLALMSSLIALARDADAGDVTVLTSAYIAATYNLAYACGGNQIDPTFPLSGDNVERIVLQFARKRAPQFSSVLGAARKA